MASNRHLGRIVAMQTLYELDFRLSIEDKTVSVADILQRNINRYSEVVEDKKFIEAVVNGVLDKVKELDGIIQPVAPDWPLDQIARIDRTVLRMGVYELTYQKNVPSKVVINEAVELAKSFGADNSSKFVNGVLGTVYKQLGGDEAEAARPKKAKKPAAKPTKKK